LTCFAVPEGLGVKLAERSDSKFYDKGNDRSKQLLGDFHYSFYEQKFFLY